MKFKINSREIITALKFVIGLNQTNYTNNGFNYVLISTENGEVNFKWSSDSIAGVFRVKNGMKVIEEGKVLVKGKVLLNLISKIKETTIDFELIDNVLKMTADNYTSNINTVDIALFKYSEFDVNDWESVEIPNEVFSLGVKKVQNSSVLHSETISKFNGIYVSTLKKDELQFIATDSYKLSLKTFKFEHLAPLDFLVKTSVMLQIINYLKINEKIKIFKRRNELVLKTNDFILRCSTIDAEFPNISNLINLEKNISFKTSLKELMSALDRIIYLTSNDKNHNAELKVNSHIIELECKNSDLGSSNEKISLIESNINEFKVSFNALYLYDLLKNLDHDVVNFLFVDQDNPFHVLDEKEKDFIQVLVPLIN